MNKSGQLLGRRVARARDERGWNQSDLARRADVSVSYVNRLESGYYQRPSLDRLAAIARALGVDVRDLAEPPSDVPEDLVEQLRALAGTDDGLLAEVFANLRALPPEDRAGALRITLQALELYRSSSRRG